MIDRYDHAVGIYAELNVERLVPLHEAIPELAEMDPGGVARDNIVGIATAITTSARAPVANASPKRLRI